MYRGICILYLFTCTRYDYCLCLSTSRIACVSNSFTFVHSIFAFFPSFDYSSSVSISICIHLFLCLNLPLYYVSLSLSLLSPSSHFSHSTIDILSRTSLSTFLRDPPPPPPPPPAPSQFPCPLLPSHFFHSTQTKLHPIYQPSSLITSFLSPLLTPYARHKLTESMNVSLLCLSVSDLLSLIFLQWFNVCVNPLLVNSDVPFYPPEFQYVTGGEIPHSSLLIYRNTDRPFGYEIRSFRSHHASYRQAGQAFKEETTKLIYFVPIQHPFGWKRYHEATRVQHDRKIKE